MMVAWVNEARNLRSGVPLLTCDDDGDSTSPNLNTDDDGGIKDRIGGVQVTVSTIRYGKNLAGSDVRGNVAACTVIDGDGGGIDKEGHSVHGNDLRLTGQTVGSASWEGRRYTNI